MHIASRILTTKASTENEAEVRERIHAWLQSAPGIDEVKTLSTHPKGGFIFTAEAASELTEEFVAYVEESEFMLGI